MLLTSDKVEINLIENFLCEKTYLGILLGDPNERKTRLEMENFLLKVLKFNYLENNALCRSYIYVLPPKMVEVNEPYRRKHSRLPDYACAARLVSNSIIGDEDCDFSEVVLIFYLNHTPLINKVNFSDIIKKLSWKDIAHDASF